MKGLLFSPVNSFLPLWQVSIEKSGFYMQNSASRSFLSVQSINGCYDGGRMREKLSSTKPCILIHFKIAYLAVSKRLKDYFSLKYNIFISITMG